MLHAKPARENVETVASQTVIQRVNTSSLAHKSPVFGESLTNSGEVKPSSRRAQCCNKTQRNQDILNCKIVR